MVKYMTAIRAYRRFGMWHLFSKGTDSAMRTGH